MKEYYITIRPAVCDPRPGMSQYTELMFHDSESQFFRENKLQPRYIRNVLLQNIDEAISYVKILLITDLHDRSLDPNLISIRSYNVTIEYTYASTIRSRSYDFWYNSYYIREFYCHNRTYLSAYQIDTIMSDIDARVKFIMD